MLWNKRVVSKVSDVIFGETRQSIYKTVCRSIRVQNNVNHSISEPRNGRLWVTKMNRYTIVFSNNLHFCCVIVYVSVKTWLNYIPKRLQMNFSSK